MDATDNSFKDHSIQRDQINKLRGNIDDITLQMLHLFRTRTDVVRKIGALKHEMGIGITDEARENTLLQKVIHTCHKEDIDESVATRFLNFLLGESIRVQSIPITSQATHLSVFLKAKAIEQQGKKVIHLEVGEPDFAPPDVVGSSLLEACNTGHFKYGSPEGMPKFRDGLAEYISDRFCTLDTIINSKNVLVTPGARFAIFSAVTSLLRPCDEVIIIEPAWPAYRDCVVHAGARVRSLHTTLEDSWNPSIEQLDDNITPSTKMIILNYPNNPTGKILDPKIMNDIIELASKHDIYVISDEIYSSYASPTWKSVLWYGYPKAIAVQSFSKSHAMTGFRIGYAASFDSDVIQKMSALNALCLTSVCEPVQYAAMHVLYHDTSNNTNTMRNRLGVLIKQAKSLGLQFAVPDGGMYLFARVTLNGFDGTTFSNRMLNEEGVAVAPGAGFGSYKDFIRISACQDTKTLIDGMSIIGRMIQKGVKIS